MGDSPGDSLPPAVGSRSLQNEYLQWFSAHRASRGRGIRRGTRRGCPGDSRGTRWGFPGDSLPFWGTRSEKAIIFFGFQGDSPETTFGFYNIKKGLVVACGGAPGDMPLKFYGPMGWTFFWVRLRPSRRVFASEHEGCNSAIFLENVWSWVEQALRREEQKSDTFTIFCSKLLRVSKRYPGASALIPTVQKRMGAPEAKSACFASEHEGCNSAIFWRMFGAGWSRLCGGRNRSPTPSQFSVASSSVFPSATLAPALSSQQCRSGCWMCCGARAG